ncbi:type II toxin-antitoxin system RelE family toxin [Thiocapsa bogorovii]|uniref:type II toxin-antitoxin system RelE family toxin n=1 Tax=Thiocapsa bogorovii TaxID=521689 RepID=UPI001E54DA0B|nr:type II toxin-antitoxin system RelE/ParE family toxin [Thiocapsa bogorovii]UHD16109.1 type II toxin-antitoxin system RelE/ParE family toxin [Thiocapsa bogorovii]
MKVELKPQAVKDMCGLQKPDAARIAKKLSELESGLTGDIKRLTDFTPEYRLRVGNDRVLFEVEEATVVVYRVMHRKHVYAKR